MANYATEMYGLRFSISLSLQGPARKPKLIEQGITIFNKLNEKLNTTRAHNETQVAISLLTQSHTNTDIATGY